MEPPSGPRRAVLYARISKVTPGREEDASVDHQIDRMLTQARAEGVEVIGPFRDDGISASRYAGGKAREGWQQTMAAIVAGRATELWAWEVSRATRDRTVWATLVSACIAQRVLMSVGGRLHNPLDAEDGFMLDLQAALAVRESAVISKRIKAEVAARAAAGKPHGKVPYGYLREYDPLTRALLRQIPDPETAPIVEELVRRILAGESMYAIAADLNARGVPSPEAWRKLRMEGPSASVSRMRWRADEVKGQALSPTVAGMRIHQGKVITEAEWAPIIRPAQHAQVVAFLRPDGPGKWFGPVKHLLTGIAECGVCGAPMRRIKNRSTPSYACFGQQRRGASCVIRSQLHLDAYVTRYVVTALRDPQLVERIAAQHADSSDRTGGLTREIADLEARLHVIERSMATAAGTTVESFVRVIADVAGQIDAKRAELERSSALPPLVLATAGSDAADRWVALGVEQHRHIVRALVRVVVHRSTRPRGARGFDPSTIEIVDL